MVDSGFSLAVVRSIHFGWPSGVGHGWCLGLIGLVVLNRMGVVFVVIRQVAAFVFGEVLGVGECRRCNDKTKYWIRFAALRFATCPVFTGMTGRDGNDKEGAKYCRVVADAGCYWYCWCYWGAGPTDRSAG